MMECASAYEHAAWGADCIRHMRRGGAPAAYCHYACKARSTLAPLRHGSACMPQPPPPTVPCIPGHCQKWRAMQHWLPSKQASRAAGGLGLGAARHVTPGTWRPWRRIGCRFAPGRGGRGQCGKQAALSPAMLRWGWYRILGMNTPRQYSPQHGCPPPTVVPCTPLPKLTATEGICTLGVTFATSWSLQPLKTARALNGVEAMGTLAAPPLLCRRVVAGCPAPETAATQQMRPFAHGLATGPLSLLTIRLF